MTHSNWAMVYTIIVYKCYPVFNTLIRCFFRGIDPNVIKGRKNNIHPKKKQEKNVDWHKLYYIFSVSLTNLHILRKVDRIVNISILSREHNSIGRDIVICKGLSANPKLPTYLHVVNMKLLGYLTYKIYSFCCEYYKIALCLYVYLIWFFVF